MPIFRAFRRPLDEMCATFLFEDFQATCFVRFWAVPSEKTAVAIICSVAPAATVGLAGVTISEVRVGEVTVTFVEL